MFEFIVSCPCGSTDSSVPIAASRAGALGVVNLEYSTSPEDGRADEERTAYWFAIVQPERGELIGEIGLVGISWPSRRAGLSILVLPRSRRTGVGREAIELMMGWAQSELGLHRIELHTLPENAPMQGLAEAAGFRHEGVLRDYGFERGRFVDNVVYARLLV